VSFDPNAAAAHDSGIFGLPNASPNIPDDARVVLIPVPWDATTSYRRGTAKGPRAILAASHQVDLFDIEIGRPYETGIAMLDEPVELHRMNDRGRVLADVARGEGDGPNEVAVAELNHLGEQVNEWVRASAQVYLDHGRVVGVVGGDHSSPFGAIQAYAALHPGMGILHIDAHADLRPAYERFTWSHASIMYNVLAHIPIAKLVQVGIRDLSEGELQLIQGDGRIRTFFDAQNKREQLGGTSWASIVARVVEELPAEVYVSFDVDGLDPALCPHTGTPVPGGLSFAEAVYLLGSVVGSGRRIVGFDLNEVAPGPSGDEWDANVGARLLYKLIGLSLFGRSQ